MEKSKDVCLAYRIPSPAQRSHRSYSVRSLAVVVQLIGNPYNERSAVPFQHLPSDTESNYENVRIYVFRFSWQWCSYCGLLGCDMGVLLPVDTNILEEYAASIFRMKVSGVRKFPCFIGRLWGTSMGGGVTLSPSNQEGHATHLSTKHQSHL